METMVLYGLKTCDTCRKALKSLPAARFVDVRSDGVPEKVLKAAHAQFGDRLLNTRSTTWRGLSATERACPPLELLKDHPALLKRPLSETGTELVLGWDADARKALGVA